MFMLMLCVCVVRVPMDASALCVCTSLKVIPRTECGFSLGTLTMSWAGMVDSKPREEEAKGRASQRKRKTGCKASLSILYADYFPQLSERPTATPHGAACGMRCMLYVDGVYVIRETLVLHSQSQFARA